MADLQVLAELLRGKKTSPIEDEYSPIDAAIIGAGRATSNLIDTAKAYGYQGIGNIYDAVGNSGQAADYANKSAQIKKEMQVNDGLYQPLAKAYPMATFLGEQTPAFLNGGLRAYEMAVMMGLGDMAKTDYRRQQKLAQEQAQPTMLSANR